MTNTESCRDEANDYGEVKVQLHFRLLVLSKADSWCSKWYESGCEVFVRSVVFSEKWIQTGEIENIENREGIYSPQVPGVINYLYM